MKQRSVPRRWLAGLALLLALLLLLTFAVPALADYLGPDRTISVWEWRRLHCHYEAVYDPGGTGWYGCTLDLHYAPDATCPPRGNVVGYFNPSDCGWPSDFCADPGCDISASSSIESCSASETGCRSVERITTLPEAAISGSVSCGSPGTGGWCLGAAEASLSGSEPLAGYGILALEGTRNGESFACPGDACAVPLSEGMNDFTFWAISSWGDTSRMGTASGMLDSQAPVISGEISGIAGDSGWFVSDVAFSASASDPSPGSGVWGLEASLDGGAWSAYTGPLTFSDGGYTVVMRASDAAGNINTVTQVIYVDTQPPTVNMTASGEFCPGCGELLAVTFEVTDSLSGIAGWELSADGVEISSGAEGTSQTLMWDGSGLPGGVHTLSLEARDAAGNAQGTSVEVMLRAPAPPRATNTPYRPLWTAPPPTPTETSTPRLAPTRTAQPTRTSSVSVFGGPPIAPIGPEASPPPELQVGPESAPTPAVEEPPSGVLWGAAALALIGTATALAIERRRKREEEEARLREEMQKRNAAQRAREEAEAAAIAAARQAEEATEAALLAAERSSEEALEWQEDELAARDAGRDQAAEAHADAMARQRAERIAAAVAAEEARRAIVEGRNEPVPGTGDNGTVPRQTGIGSLVRRIFGAARSAESSYEASALQLGDLDGGYVSVSGSQDFSQAARANTRAAWDLRGTRYRPDTIAGRVRGGLIGRAVSRGSILFSAGAALLGNLIDYGLGEHRETGVVSPEFAVSTVVDFGLAVFGGAAAALIVGSVIAAASVTVPVWLAVGVTALAATGIGLGIEGLGIGDWAKQNLLSLVT